nr:MAG TPA: hypothetical protein [Caudoviricetes sp.]
MNSRPKTRPSPVSSRPNAREWVKPTRRRGSSSYRAK